ncbi:MAG: protein kinase [Acidobacteria bacterium]|nr:protein kinase [Acidobacteriota bacterium]
MDPAKWKLIKNDLAAALELSGPDRDRYVEALDVSIRPEVERLLAAESSAKDFIEEPAIFGIAEITHETDRTPDQIDGYRLLRTLGTGGMGTVYLAERSGQGFNQQVALKIIKRGMDTSSILKRFLMERQILADLDHPNIARMLDGGSTEDGLPYFVMEYVDGLEVRRFCNDNAFGLAERLELFLKICGAVSEAHRNLVVHRDLKPTNILVADDGEPKLLDFGIAKLLLPDWQADTNEATLTQFRVMTPEYASPEQLAGRATSTSTDVYSLGVILYELLTGERPFKTQGKAPQELIDSILSKEPQRPSLAASTRNTRFADETNNGSVKNTNGRGNIPVLSAALVDSKLLQGDLDNVVLKALHPEQDRRYRSVDEFAEDIRRFQDGLPVTATADSKVYRFQKFVSRNRFAFFASAAGAILLVMLSAFAGWQAVRANNERAAAERRFEQLRELANYLVFDAHDQISDLPGSTAARKELVERALKYLDGLYAEAGEDMTLKRELAAGYERIGDVQGGPLQANLGEYDNALKSFARAIELRDELASKDGDNSDLYAAAMLRSKVVRILQVRNDPNAAEEHLSKAEVLLEDLSAKEPSNILYRVTQARFAFELGELLSSKKDSDLSLAAEQYKKSISVSDQITPNDETTARGADGLSLYEKALSVKQFGYRRLGQQAETAGDNTAALDNYMNALDASRQLFEAFDPPSVSAEMVYAISLGNAGRLQAANGNIPEGLEKAEKMLEIFERAVKADPNNKLAGSELAAAHFSVAYVLQKQGDHDRAIKSYQQALAIQEDIRSSDPENVYNLGSLAQTLISLGNVMEDRAATSSDNKVKSEQVSKARNYYSQSRTLLAGLRASDKLPAYLSKLSEQTEKRLLALN